MTMRLESPAIAFELPQLWMTSAARARGRSAALDRVIERCVRRFGTGDLLVDSQAALLPAGAAIASPWWCRPPRTSNGEVGLIAFGSAPMIETRSHEARRVAPNRLVIVRTEDAVRFLRAPEEGWVALVFVRRRDGARALERDRHCARIFQAPQPVAEELPGWARGPSVTFRSGLRAGPRIGRFSQACIAAEPSLKSASVAFARRHGGAITRAFLESLPPSWTADGADVLIQARRDELSPGWWPALKDWHVDGEKSVAARADGTPDLRAPGAVTDQLALCAGPTARTLFLEGTITLPEPPLYTPAEEARAVRHRVILDALASGAVRARLAPADTLIGFGWGDLHRRTSADRPGWRFFVKAQRGARREPEDRISRHGVNAWPVDAAERPGDPFGVFHAEVPK